MNEVSGPRRRPKIGLALGGGVARGWAHIGVMRALLKLGIEPDIICGTSVGALVGGCWLTGHLDTLENWARGLTRRRMISYLDIRLGGGGILGGQKLSKLLYQYLDDIQIESLSKPFAAVCTELSTGHEIWIQNGGLADAIRASYALPGVFAPVKHNGQWLVDGALINPVPISVCRALGARLVIGVTLNADTFGKGMIEEGKALDALEADPGQVMREASAGSPLRPDRIIMKQLFGANEDSPGITTVMLGALNIVMDRLARSRMAGDPPDVLISPRIGHISLLDFDRAAECIALGEDAVHTAITPLREALGVLGS
jgi:NTE family protein